MIFYGSPFKVLHKIITVSNNMHDLNNIALMVKLQLFNNST